MIFTGNGKAGSWKIRGEQLGAAVGAEVVPNAEMSEIRGTDWVVVVKRTPEDLIRKIRQAGKKWVWDVVDAWPQPKGNGWEAWTAVSWLKDSLSMLQPNAVVFPSTRMLADSQWRGASLVLPHHAWPKYLPRVVSARINRVGYEGDPRYLGAWHDVVLTECQRRGWDFVTGDLSECDVGICLRDVTGYPCSAWKANTKLANCQALGIPAICSPEESYVEFGSGAEYFATCADDVRRAFNELDDYEARLGISAAMQAATPRLSDVAGVYGRWLSALR